MIHQLFIYSECISKINKLLSIIINIPSLVIIQISVTHVDDSLMFPAYKSSTLNTVFMLAEAAFINRKTTYWIYIYIYIYIYIHTYIHI